MFDSNGTLPPRLLISEEANSQGYEELSEISSRRFFVFNLYDGCPILNLLFSKLHWDTNYWTLSNLGAQKTLGAMGTSQALGGSDTTVQITSSTE